MDRNEYDDYMRNLIGYLEFVSTTEEVQQTLLEQDMKELAISKLPCYSNLEELMNSIREM